MTVVLINPDPKANQSPKKTVASEARKMTVKPSAKSTPVTKISSKPAPKAKAPELPKGFKEPREGSFWKARKSGKVFKYLKVGSNGKLRMQPLGHYDYYDVAPASLDKLYVEVPAPKTIPPKVASGKAGKEAAAKKSPVKKDGK